MPRNKSTEWKINNNFAPHYARLIMEQEPDLKGFFEVRELRAGEVADDAAAVKTWFQEFHAANSWVYDELVRLARKLKERAQSRTSIHLLICVVRWFKLNGEAA